MKNSVICFLFFCAILFSSCDDFFQGETQNNGPATINGNQCRESFPLCGIDFAFDTITFDATASVKNSNAIKAFVEITDTEGGRILFSSCMFQNETLEETFNLSNPTLIKLDMYNAENVKDSDCFADRNLSRSTTLCESSGIICELF